MKPLTDEEWFAFWKTSPAIPGDSMYTDFLDIAKAIEAAVNARWEREVAMQRVSQFAQEQEADPIGYTNPIDWGLHESERVVKVTRKPQPQYGLTSPLQSKPVERNFCPRCGKRLGKEKWDIHTCTAPMEKP